MSTLAAIALALVGFASNAHAELRDYTVRWLPSVSAGVEGYELSVTPTGGGTVATFDLGHPAVASGEMQYAMELDDSLDLQLRLRAYAGDEYSVFSNEIVVAKADVPGIPEFGVSNVAGATGVVAGDIVVTADTFGAVASVEFLLDGSSYRIENAAPWSLQGDGGEPGTENPLDTTALADGEHTLEVVGYSAADASGTRGDAVTVSFYVDNSAVPVPDPIPVPDPDPTPTPDPTPPPTPDPVPPSGPQGAIAGLQAADSGDLVALHVDGSTSVVTNHEYVGRFEVHPVWCDLDDDGDDDLVVGFGAGAYAKALLVYLEDGEEVEQDLINVVHRRMRVDFAETWPACGDTDGDGLNELAFGLGPKTAASIAMLDDQSTGYAYMQASFKNVLRTLPSTLMFGFDYARNGWAQPVLADVDGDGLAEVIVGRSAGGQGTVSIYDDAQNGFALFAELKADLGVLEVLSDPDYQVADGATAVAAGDIDGDGIDEIVVGTAGVSGSHLYVYDDAGRGFELLTETTTGPELGHAAPGAMATSVWPTLADIDDDGLPELALGFGDAGDRQILLLDDLLTRFAPLVWTGDADGMVQAPDAIAPISSALKAP